MLFQVVELADLFVDACLRNESGELMFLSVYGRDTAVQQFKATLQLKPNSGGLNSFTLKACENAQLQSQTVYVGNPDRFEVYSGRFPKDNLFGNLTQLWIYDPILTKPDKSLKTGWVLSDKPWDLDGVKDELISGLWGMYKQLSQIPLLDIWKDRIMHLNNEIYVKWCHATNYPPLGNISACLLKLEDDFNEVVSSMVKNGDISLDGVNSILPVNQESIMYTKPNSYRNDHSREQLQSCMTSLKPFLSQQQFMAMKEFMKGEEGEFFVSKFIEMGQRVNTMPYTYQQSKEADPIAYLHYFIGDSDWYITEKDKEDGVSQAFGYAILNGDLMFAELGYIPIDELASMGVDFDLHFEPTPLSKIKEKLKQRYGVAA